MNKYPKIKEYIEQEMIDIYRKIIEEAEEVEEAIENIHNFIKKSKWWWSYSKKKKLEHNKLVLHLIEEIHDDIQVGYTYYYKLNGKVDEIALQHKFDILEKTCIMYNIDIQESFERHCDKLRKRNVTFLEVE